MPRTQEADASASGARGASPPHGARRFVLLAPNDCRMSERVARTFASASPQLQARWMRAHACALKSGVPLPLDAVALAAAELRTLAGAAVVVEGRSVRVGASGVVQWSGVYALGDLCAVVVISELLVH